MTLAFETNLDVVNQACILLGVDQIVLSDFQGNPFLTKAGRVFNGVYDKLRVRELERNCWTKATRRFVLRPVETATLVYVPPAWSDTTAYAAGALVLYNGVVYQCVNANTGQTPSNTSIYWSPFGLTLTISQFSTASQPYGQNAIVVLSGTAYISLITDNNDTPPTSNWLALTGSVTTYTQLWTPPAYSATSSYTAGTIVVYQGDYYQAQPGVSVGDIPNTALTWFKYFGPLTVDPWGINLPFNPQPVATSYYPGEIVSYNGANYLSLTTNNISTPGASSTWMVIGGTLSAIQILYPLNTGPRSDVTTWNIFKLPYGYLRKCPKNPKAQVNMRLGAPAYNGEDDYVTEGGYVVSQQGSPIFIRCVVDMIDVQNMDAMFCHALAGQLAWHGCEAITQAADKKQAAEAYYKWAIQEAGTVDGIEEGAVEPVEDEYLMVRL